VAASVNAAAEINDKVNILLVDDSEAKLLSHEVVLAEIGETLFKASSAREAFEYLLKNEIALILIDVCMPDLDGFELAAMIREHPRFQHTAIIFVSAVMNAYPDQLRGYQLGAVDYVPVPVVPELLRAKVKVFVDLYRKTRQLERFNAELEQRVSERTAALQSFNEELEQRIDQRTRERETALAQLFEAQKMDTIGRLTGGVAHDFNNLLMAVLGSLSLLEKRLPEDAQCRRFLQNAVQGAQRGAALTQRLLAFSRRQELKPESVNLSELVSGMGELLKRALGIEVDLVCQFPMSLSPVLVDSNQLELALLNLALNARDAMPSGGTLTIQAAEEVVGQSPGDSLGAGEYVRVGVSDTGVGMDEATRAKATDPFFTTKGPGKGTGLGLSMVHGLAAQSGGQLRIVSTPGVGTTVELWLPRAKTDAVSLVRSAERPIAAAPPATASWRVLIVDDDLLVLTGTAALIEDLGHVAIEVPSASDALAVLASDGAIDVIVTDHAMPNMTGLQLAQSVQEKYPGIPIVLATGYAELPADPAEIGVVKLAKPCSQAEIAAAIQTAMSFARRNRRRAAGS
jgi:signal transduction histidine kinase